MPTPLQIIALRPLPDTQHLAPWRRAALRTAHEELLIATEERDIWRTVGAAQRITGGTAHALLAASGIVAGRLASYEDLIKRIKKASDPLTQPPMGTPNRYFDPAIAPVKHALNALEGLTHRPHRDRHHDPETELAIDIAFTWAKWALRLVDPHPLVTRLGLTEPLSSGTIQKILAVAQDPQHTPAGKGLNLLPDNNSEPLTDSTRRSLGVAVGRYLTNRHAFNHTAVATARMVPNQNNHDTFDPAYREGLVYGLLLDDEERLTLGPTTTTAAEVRIHSEGAVQAIVDILTHHPHAENVMEHLRDAVLRCDNPLPYSQLRDLYEDLADGHAALDKASRRDQALPEFHPDAENARQLQSGIYYWDCLMEHLALRLKNA